jgi:hypothetical protein
MELIKIVAFRREHKENTISLQVEVETHCLPSVEVHEQRQDPTIEEAYIIHMAIVHTLWMQLGMQFAHITDS